MRYQLAIFDMDGTILDTLDDLHGSLNYALAQKGYPARTREEVRQFVGNGIARLIALAVPEGISDADRTEVLEVYRAHYQMHCNDHAHPYDGISEVLRELKAQGMRLAVVSNKPDAAVGPLCALHFPGLFDLAIGERDGLARKPAPDMVAYALHTLECNEKDAVYIGDSEVDIATAANGGLDLIAVDWGFRDTSILRENGAETIISDPRGLLPLLR